MNLTEEPFLDIEDNDFFVRMYFLYLTHGKIRFNCKGIAIKIYSKINTTVK